MGQTGGRGGRGGGGDGAGVGGGSHPREGRDGAANTGGGGGGTVGGDSRVDRVGAGGSGVVVVRYRLSESKTNALVYPVMERFTDGELKEGEEHEPLDSLSVSSGFSSSSLVQNKDYIVVHEGSPDPSVFSGLDEKHDRIAKLKGVDYSDRPWAYYVVLTRRNAAFSYVHRASGSGPHVFMVRINTDGSGKNDSFRVRVNGGRAIDWHLGRTPRGWRWVSRVVDLRKGVNRIELVYREPTALSAVRIVRGV